MKIVKRYRTSDMFDPLPTEPFVMDTRALDISNTLVAMINTLPPNCVGISLRWFTESHNRKVERAARRKGLRVFWMPHWKYMFSQLHEYEQREQQKQRERLISQIAFDL